MPAPRFLTRRPTAPSARPSGFTTIELMVAVSIVAILGALALPGFDGIIERHRVRSATEDLTSTLYLTRSEAIRRGGHVALSKVASSECSTTEARDWSCGWLLFADNNDNGVHEPGEERIQVWPAARGVKATMNVGSVGTGTYLKADRWGQLNGVGAFSITLRPQAHLEDDARASVMCVSAGGRLRTVQGAAEC